ncbi:MAG: hypothetical protein L3J41_12355 [Melioribacteraceae bacterium]|nr:hypothetical protein [Melioribacteraceae bacterium]
MIKYYFILLFVLILDISCSDNSNPIIPENEESYVFAFIDGDYPNQNLIIMNLENSKQDTLIKNMQINSFPIWSNDGNKILISSDGLIYTINKDGSDFKMIGNKMENLGHPQWSFDNQYIVFPTNEVQENAIAIFNNSTIAENYITFEEGGLGGPHSFACSPLNYNFLFVNYKDRFRRLYLMNFIDSSYSQVAIGSSIYDPSWSREGKMFAYGYRGERESGIYIQNVGDTCSKIISEGLSSARLPKWSHDNTKISFCGTTSGDSHGLYYVDLLLEKQFIIDNNKMLIQNGSWSNDSNYIVYHRINNDDSFSIMIFNVASGENTELLNSKKQLKYPIFSPSS